MHVEPEPNVLVPFADLIRRDGVLPWMGPGQSMRNTITLIPDARAVAPVSCPHDPNASA